jgi:hypothetical protein
MYNRFLAPFGAIVLLCLVAGCSSFFPSFEGPLGIGSAITNIPVSAVAERVQCELNSFVKDEKYNWLLDPRSNASLSLSLETDNQGKVTWLGIDLSKLGPLAPLSSLVTAASKVPSLQASGTLKSTISSQIDFNVSQDPRKPSNCDAYLGTPVRYYLKEWLVDFVKNLKSEPNADSKSLCMTKITLKTAFTIVVDVNGGLTPLVPSTLILPVSGTNFDYSPTFINSLNIALAVKHDDTNAICKTPAAQPNVTLRTGT